MRKNILSSNSVFIPEFKVDFVISVLNGCPRYIALNIQLQVASAIQIFGTIHLFNYKNNEMKRQEAIFER